MAKIVMTEVRKRGFFGKLWKWFFILFNLAMAIWAVSYWIAIGNMISSSASDAHRAGAAIGGTLGTGMLLMMWIIGAGILGALALATRGKKIIIQETVE